VALIAACGSASDSAVDTARVGVVGGGTASPSVHPQDFVIDSGGIGRLRLGMTLDSARRALPATHFARETDADGVILVGVTFGKDTTVLLFADESDPATIDWTKRIQQLETFSPAFHTAAGVHVGSLVTDVEKWMGPVKRIVLSEIESRQYVAFTNQPPWLTFRLDYTGEFADGSNRTTQFAPGAKIFSVMVAR
jgi:hypothetical protein